MRTWKKLLCLLLATFMTIMSLSACGGEAAEPTEPVIIEPEGEAKVLKVLTLGHSLAVIRTI